MIFFSTFALTNRQKLSKMKKIFLAITMLLLANMAAMAQETTYAKSDFVPGDEIFFDDNFEREKVGEFPL